LGRIEDLLNSIAGKLEESNQEGAAKMDQIGGTLKCIEDRVKKLENKGKKTVVPKPGGN
jgi:hypothetical protein